jgi:hypothetical protein
MSLADWEKNGWIKGHSTSREEIAALLGVVDRDLSDCQTRGLSADWKLSIAYNAALQAATAALAAAGYRAGRDAHHYRVIQSLQLTVAPDPNWVNQLEKFRKKRNIGGYERAGAVSDKEAKEMIHLAQQLTTAVKKWLAKKYPKLIKE